MNKYCTTLKGYTIIILLIEIDNEYGIYITIINFFNLYSLYYYKYSSKFIPSIVNDGLL